MSRQTSNQRPADSSRDLAFRPDRRQDLKPAPARGNNPGGGGGGGGGPKCFKCNKSGHVAKDCPENYDIRRGDLRVPNPGGIQGDGRGYSGGSNRGGLAGVGGPRGSGTAVAPSPSSSKTTVDKENEDTLITNFKGVKRTAVANPYRPNYGALGEKAEVLANYFAMNMKESLVLHSYTVTFAATFKENGDRVPDPKGKKLKQIIRLMLDSRDFETRKSSIVTDFQLNLISLEPLPEDIRNQKVDYFHEADGAARSNARTYNLHIAPVNEFPVLGISDLKGFLTSTARTAQYPAKASMVQALNILIGHSTVSTPTTTIIGGKRAFPQGSESRILDSGLIAERGFFSSVRLASHRTLINVNISHGAFYRAVDLPTLMEDYGVEFHQYEALETFVKGLKVKTNYLKDKQGNQITMTRTISGFAHLTDGSGQTPQPKVEYFAGSPFQVWFYLKDSAELAKLTAGKSRKNNVKSAGYEQREMLKNTRGQEPGYISVGEFFGEKHGIWSVADERYPVVNVGSRKDPKYIPAEACTVEPGQLSRAKLSPSQTSEMISFAKISPSEVVQKITTKGLRTMGLSPGSPQMGVFGVNVDENMVKVLGRILSPPNIQYGNKNFRISDGNWNLRDGSRFKNPKPLRRWEYLAIRSSKAKEGRHVRDATELQPSMNLLIKILKNVGVQASEPKGGRTLDIVGPNDGLLSKTIEKAASEKLDILFVILPEKDAVLYNSVKKLADVTWGVQTICVVGQGAKFYKKGAEQYCANVALKFNLKLDGTNHVLSDPRNQQAKRIAIISENKTMVVGIDVTHPGPGSANPSIAAMVASVDADLAVWPADLKVQIRTRQEMVTLLGEMLRSRLELWEKKHHDYPENILVYRDGVSESQYEQVLENEFSLMKKACTPLYSGAKKPPPKFTIIIVGKRHHTRFFPQAGSQVRDKFGNPRCGLVVDRGITEARNWDFFLQSHSSHLGTARPSHYYVIWDEIFTNPEADYIPSGMNPADLLEQVTHDMCYLFGRATRAVSLCPPVYYADIACERAGRYLAGRSYGSDSGRSESEMNEADRERLRRTLQDDINIHVNLKDKMFYI